LLEPYEGKLSCTVLRGEGGSNALDLPDNQEILRMYRQLQIHLKVFQVCMEMNGQYFLHLFQNNKL